MSKLKKISGIAGISLAVIIVVASIVVYLFYNSRTPEVEGEFKCPGLKAAVTVVRDSWGVPHITAENGRDAFFAYGYTLAQDRLFQMEIQRRLARGELAEILGGSLVKIDRMFRTYMFRHTAEKIIAQKEKINPEALALLDSFLAGVNHFVSTQPLPVEFSLLGIKPRPFNRLDSLSMLGYMAYSFTDGINTDSLHAILKKKLPGRDFESLFPLKAGSSETTIMDRQAAYKGGGSAAMNHQPGPDAVSSSTGVSEPGIFSAIAGKAETFMKAAVFSPASEESLAEYMKRIPLFAGSNSWVVSPRRSASGKALLANDPHIAHSLPGVWYEAHIKYGDVENYGYHLPMYPFPLIAHNSSRGWAVTMFENDDLDLYYEKFKEDDPGRVMYKGQWVKVQQIKEAIKVKGKPDEEIVITVTPHGPVISEFLEGYEGPPVSMWWVFLNKENPVLDITYNMFVSRTLNDFKKAIAPLAAPGLNLSWADSAGNIAWWAAGCVPIRPAHMNNKMIHDGASGRDEIGGCVPFEQNPQLVNPPSGIIVTANNRPTVRPVGPTNPVPGYWRPDDRASRITELLASKEKWSVEDIMALQNDVFSVAARETLPVINGILESAAGRDGVMTSDEKEGAAVLKSWNLRYETDSAGAVIFHFLTHYILREAVVDETGEENFMSYIDTSDSWIFLKSFIKDAGSEWWDDITTKEKESREDIILRAYKKALADAGGRLSGSPDGWRWGDLHRLEYVHPVGMKKPMNLIYNIGPYEAPGEAHLINRIKTNHGKLDFIVTSLPSTRLVLTMGDHENTYSILPAGNSGNVMSPNYGDQVKMFVAGKYRKLNFTKEQIEASETRTMKLVPGVTDGGK